MGYDFLFKREGEDQHFRLNIHDMEIMRVIMLEVGAVVGPGFEQALVDHGYQAFAPTQASVSMEKFQSNSDWHVTPEECRLIADRLEKGLSTGLVTEVLGFFDDDQEFLDSVVDRVAPFADYNRRAADHGGYRVR